MEKLMYIYLGIVLACFVFGCEESENTHIKTLDVEYVKYGTSFGECLGYCSNEISFSASEIDFLAKGWNMEGQLPDIAKSIEQDETLWDFLHEEIDCSAFSQLDSIIGCPDCADGGAEWIEIKTEGLHHKVIFEYGNEPEAVKKYIATLRTYLKAFKNAPENTINFNNQIFIAQHGFIRNFVASRGVYQYLLGTAFNNDTVYYYDKNLDATYKKEKLQVKFYGILQNDSTVIKKPSANDVPTPDFKVRNIEIIDMEIMSN